MIVTCEKCRTRYRLDDARVSERGARVRCSRCKHAFHLPSAAEREQQMHAIASGAAAAEGPLEGPPGSDGAGAGDDPERHAGLHAPQDLGPQPEPEGGAAPEREEAPAPAAGAPGRTGAAEPEAEDSRDLFGFDIGGDLPSSEPLGSDAAERRTDDAEDDWQFGDDLAPAAKETPPQSSISEGPAGAGSPVDELLREKPEEPVSPDDLGDPESWDFLGDEGDAPEEAGLGGPGGAEGESGLDLGGESRAKAGEAPQTDAGDASLEMPSTPLEAFEVEPELTRGRSLRWLQGALHGLGWVATLGLLAVIAHGSLIAPSGLGREPARLAVDGLVAEGLRGRFVESRAGQVLYVVSGRLRASGADASGTATSSRGRFDTEPGRSASALRVRLLDSRGAPIDGARAWVGAALPEAVLRETPPEALRRELARRAVRLAWSRPLPQSGLRFDAVFETLPREAARFRLEAAAAPALPVERAPAVTPAAGSAAVREIRAGDAER